MTIANNTPSENNEYFICLHYEISHFIWLCKSQCVLNEHCIRKIQKYICFMKIFVRQIFLSTGIIKVLSVVYGRKCVDKWESLAHQRYCSIIHFDNRYECLHILLWCDTTTLVYHVILYIDALTSFIQIIVFVKQWHFQCGYWLYHVQYTPGICQSIKKTLLHLKYYKICVNLLHNH